MSISITALAYALPSKRLTNTDLAERFGAQVMKKIATASGILERRIAARTCMTGEREAVQNLPEEIKKLKKFRSPSYGDVRRHGAGQSKKQIVS